MSKISVTELSEMVKAKLMEKGLSENDINEEIVKTISEKVRNIANEDYKSKVPQEIEEPEVVGIDVSSTEVPSEVPGEQPAAITQTVESNIDAEENARKDGEISERERALAAREEDLRAREEELQRRTQEIEYKPELPKEIENIGPEKLFVFDMSKLSSGAEGLSNLKMKKVDNPEEEVTMKELWLDDAKKTAEVFVVKFEKAGEVEFDPFEGTSEYKVIRNYENVDNNLNDLQNDVNTGLKTGDVEHIPDERPSNMSDSIEPVKDVSQPMTGDMGLEVEAPESNIENNSEIAEAPQQNSISQTDVEDVIKKLLLKVVNQ